MHKELSKKFECYEQKFLEALDMVLAAGIFSENVNYQELGALTDMAKDMMEANKDCWRAEYYKKMTEKLEKEEKEGEMRYGEMRPAGYDNRRYPSSGRFASKGHGQYYGFMPDEEMFEEEEWDEMMGSYGYNGSGRGGHGNSSGSRSGNSSMGNSGGESYGYTSPYGHAYEKYQESRRHYTESKSNEDMEKMNHDAKEHLENFKTSFKEIWKSSDPNLRKQLKGDLSSLVSELVV